MILDGNSLGGLGKKQVCGLGVLCVVVQGSAAVQLMHHVGQLGWVIVQVMPSRSSLYCADAADSSKLSQVTITHSSLH